MLNTKYKGRRKKKSPYGLNPEPRIAPHDESTIFQLENGTVGWNVIFWAQSEPEGAMPASRPSSHCSQVLTHVSILHSSLSLLKEITSHGGHWALPHAAAPAPALQPYTGYHPLLGVGLPCSNSQSTDDKSLHSWLRNLG